MATNVRQVEGPSKLMFVRGGVATVGPHRSYSEMERDG
jgi:hypothetical protein